MLHLSRLGLHYVFLNLELSIKLLVHYILTTMMSTELVGLILWNKMLGNIWIYIWVIYEYMNNNYIYIFYNYRSKKLHMWPGHHRELLLSLYLSTKVCINQLLPQHAEKYTKKKKKFFQSVELVHHHKSRGRTKKSCCLAALLCVLV